MKTGDLILRNPDPTCKASTWGTAFCSLVGKGTILTLGALVAFSALIAAADVCRALSGNHGLFHSIGFIAQFNSHTRPDPVVEKERSRLERSDLDAYKNERLRWHQLKVEVRERSTSQQSKKPTRPSSAL
jgi:hypothetical protein